MRLNLACSHDCLLHFRNVAPGRYAISVSRDGFIPQEDRKRGLTVSGLSVTVAAGQTLKDITLPMVPAPALAGTVFDPHGEPLAAALVRAYQRVYTPYGTQLKIVKKGMTNDLGEFRLFGLNFGACVVSAGYGDRDRASAVGKTQLSANVSKADDGYATAFYDGTDDMSRAAAAHLAPGLDASSLNIYLRDSARFKIRGEVLPIIAETKIIVAPKGSDLSEADYFIQPDASGAFEIRGLSTGSYVLLATAAAGTLSSDVMTIKSPTATSLECVWLCRKRCLFPGVWFWKAAPERIFPDITSSWCAAARSLSKKSILVRRLTAHSLLSASYR